MSVKSYTDEQLLNKVYKLPSFKSIPPGRWIIGVRSNEDFENRFDDKFYEFEGEKFLKVLSGTTNPGGTILRGAFAQYNTSGAAILKSNQWYYGVWKYGLHRGKMPGLLQLGSEVIVYRDGDRDGKSEQLGPEQKGWFGINFHTNTYDFSKPSLKVKQELVGMWSAGCQVSNDREKYAEMMDWYSLALKNGKQTHVTYCLLDEF